MFTYDHLRSLLIDKYGKPDKEEPEMTVKELRSSSEDPEARWFYFDPNSDKIDQVLLHTIKRNTGYQAVLKYWFENYIDECRKAQAGEL